MTTITPGNQQLNGISIAEQLLIELRTQSSLLQSTQSPTPKSDDLTNYREDAVYDVGAPATALIP
jgi:hypothetical protein